MSRAKLAISVVILLAVLVLAAWNDAQTVPRQATIERVQP